MAILFDLDASTQSSYEAGREDPLHRDAHLEVLEKLSSQPLKQEGRERSDSRPSELNILDYRRHDAILVAARRGEGKTTFLTRILREIEERKTPAGSPVLYSLGIIDPTLIESKQNIILVIIDRIRIATEHHRKRDSGTRERFEELSKSLRSMAEGLTLLDGIGGELYDAQGWSNADYVLDKGLDEASAANNFEIRLKDYVRRAAEYVGCDAFVLAIDDVDTWFERGWPVLEALRKYLAIPNLRIILSGDVDLFSLLVRRQQWRQMNKGLMEAESKRHHLDSSSSRISKIGQMVDELEDQYLIKVLPPENRISLRSLAYYQETYGLELIWNGEEESVPAKEFIEKYAGVLFAARSVDDLRPYERHLLRLPLRSAVRILQGGRDLQLDVRFPAAAADALEKMRQVFWNDLTSLKFDVNSVRDPDPASIINSLSVWLTEQKSWRSMARFYPQSGREKEDSVATFLGAVLVSIFRVKPGRMVDFWLKIAIVREKVDRGELADLEQASQESAKTVKDLLRHIATNAFESSVQFVSRLSAWEATAGRQARLGIRLSGASVPLGRIREVNSAQQEIYALEYIVGTKEEIKLTELDRRSLRAVLTCEPEDERVHEVLAAMPPALRGYHRALNKAGWSYRSKSSQNAGFQGYLVDGIGRLADRVQGEAGIVARLPINLIVSGQMSRSANYSFLRLLGVIGDLLECLPSNEEEAQSVEFSTAQKRDVVEILERHSLLRGYPTAEVTEDPLFPDDSNEDADDEEEAQAINAQDIDRLAGTIVRWLNAFAGRQGRDVIVSPLTLSRVWTRFTYTFDSIRSELKHAEDRYLGVVFYRTIIAFLHALGVECMRSAGHRVGPFSSNNPVTSPAVFASLINDIKGAVSADGAERKADLQFFDLVFSCPLWAYFLAREDSDLIDGAKRSYGAAKICEHHETRLRELNILDHYPSDVRLVGPSWEDPDKTAEFKSLFFALNIVPILGLNRKASKENDLSKTLHALASSFEGDQDDPKEPRRRTRKRPRPMPADEKSETPVRRRRQRATDEDMEVSGDGEAGTIDDASMDTDG